MSETTGGSDGESTPSARILAALRTSRGDGHLYVVAGDGRVWTTSWREGGRPDGWSPLGSALFPTGNEIAVLCNRLQDRDLFVLGQDARLWNTCWVTDKPWKQWRRWEALGRRRFPLSAGLAAVTVANTGDVAAFVIDAGGRLWMVRFPDPERGKQRHWSRFAMVDGPPLLAGGPVCAISSGRARDLAVLAIGVDGCVWTAATTWPVPAPPAPWGRWSAIEGLRAVSVGAVRHADGASAVVAVAEGGRLYSASAPPRGTWAGWSPLGRRRPVLEAGVVTMAGAQAEVRVLMLGSGGRIWTNIARDDAWAGWTAVGDRRFPGARLAALGDRESEHQALVLDVDGRVWTNTTRSFASGWDGWTVMAEAPASPG